MLNPGSPAPILPEGRRIFGLRDRGPQTRSKGGVVPAGYAGTWAVARVDFEIAGPAGVVLRRTAFDFSQLHLDRDRRAGLRDYAKVATVYYPHDRMQRPPVAAERLFQYYVLTNSPDEGARPLRMPDRAARLNRRAFLAMGKAAQ